LKAGIPAGAFANRLAIPRARSKLSPQKQIPKVKGVRPFILLH